MRWWAKNTLYTHIYVYRVAPYFTYFLLLFISLNSMRLGHKSSHTVCRICIVPAGLSSHKHLANTIKYLSFTINWIPPEATFTYALAMALVPVEWAYIKCDGETWRVRCRMACTDCVESRVTATTRHEREKKSKDKEISHVIKFQKRQISWTRVYDTLFRCWWSACLMLSVFHSVENKPGIRIYMSAWNGTE